MESELVPTSAREKQFIVLGGGIIGLSTAVRLLQKYPKATLQIIGEHFSPHTTSDVAAGLWGPYMLGKTPDITCRKWAQETHNYMHQLWQSGLAAKCGLCLVPVVELFKNAQPTPWWHDIVFGFQTHNIQHEKIELIEPELRHQSHHTAVAYITFTCEPTKLMHYYRDILLTKNVLFRNERLKKTSSLYELNINSEAIIINCLGLGAQNFTDDTMLCSVRGQVQKLKAEGVFQSFANEDCYIIPNTDTITLGGTKQESECLKVNPVDRYIIRKTCATIIPSLRNASLLSDVVGLRPVRSTGVRLEIEYASRCKGSNGKQSTIIVHNYGHGGAGITLAWGCAGAVVELVEREMKEIESKL